MSVSKSESLYQHFFRFLPEAMKYNADMSIIIHLEGIAPASFRSLFYTMIQSVIKRLDALQRHDEATLLQTWWRQWKLRRDEKCDIEGIAVLTTREVNITRCLKTTFSKDYGFSPLLPTDRTFGSIPNPVNVAPEGGFTHEYSDAVFHAFALLKNLGAINAPVTLHNATLTSLPSGYETLYPSILCIEDGTSITIL